MTKLGELLVAQLPKFDNKRIRLAEAIEMTPSRLTRAIKGEYALDVRNCLRLALAADLQPADVLRAAGKSDIADLIERAYGKTASELTASQRELIEVWDGIPHDVRAHLFVLLRHTRDVAAHMSHARNTPPPEARRRRPRAGSRKLAARSD